MTTTSRPSDIDAIRAALEPEYEILEELGRGGMAVVYRARERELDREVAVKVLPTQFAFDEGFVERFQREGRIAAQLEHPHVVPIHRVGRNGHVVYLAMKLLRGQSLSDRIRDCGRLDASEVRRILLETSSALAYASKRGVVHRDIKPDNIMLDEDGRCIVTDFGIARSATESRLTATGMSVGTPRYMSPEQARAGALDGRSDIYSLGVVGYECLVGTTPFQGGDAFAILMAHINDPVPRPALRTADERDVYHVIERMLAKNPKDRFQSADEIVALLRTPGSATGTTHAAAGSATSATIVSPAYGIAEPSSQDDLHDPSGPRPSAALDHALSVGLDLLKQQKPRFDAGLRALKTQQPKVNGAVEAGTTALVENASRARSLLASMSRTAGTTRGYLVSRSRRFWITGLAASVSVVTLYYGAHFATKHRSRCPAPAAAMVATNPAATAGSDAAAAPVQAFSLLVDAVATRSPGGKLDLYYDVCGLERGTTYTTTVNVSRNESGLKRLLGGSVQPVTMTLDATAGGPSERHHETIDIDDMPPGSYSIVLSVSDASERRRTRSTSFQISGP